VAKFDGQAVEDELSALGLCAAVKGSPDEWLAQPQAEAFTGVLPIEIAKIADGPTTALEPAAFRPLGRLRVLDFTHVVAGPTIGKLLAEHGADVIRCRYPYMDHLVRQEEHLHGSAVRGGPLAGARACAGTQCLRAGVPLGVARSARLRA
jgi:CoA-transferase family III